MWIELTPQHLETRLASAEFAALASAATDRPDVLQDVAQEIADEWRGRLARVVPLSIRPLALPSEIWTHILADYRYRAYTRLPGMSELLDELRVAEWQRALHVMDHLAKVQIALPLPGDLPELPPDAPPTPVITVPHHVLD